MRENQDIKLEKWQREVGILEDIKSNLTKYAQVKDEKGDKDEIDKLNAKIANTIEDNSWIRLEWGTIKRGKTSRADGIKKLEKKITDRKKKIEAHNAATKDETKEEKAHEKEIQKAVMDCHEGAVFYHWAYGQMEVLAMDDDYIYLKVLDKKGCSNDSLNENNVEVTSEDRTDIAKEFQKNAIGRWLFVEKDHVSIIDKDRCHKIFK